MRNLRRSLRTEAETHFGASHGDAVTEDGQLHKSLWGMNMIRYQVSDHGAGRKSVQLFDEAGVLLEDRAVVKDVNGWRVVADQSHDTPQHASPEAAAAHYAELVATR